MIFNEEKAAELIPAHMIGGLKRYIVDGIEPGSFLQAVLKNNLKEAFFCADHINKEKIGNYIEFLYNYAPGTCWGSVDKYTAWIEDLE